MVAIDRDGWYRIQGYVYLGPDKPDEIIDELMLVKTVTVDLANGQTATERRIYQNSGGALRLDDQFIPDKTWTRVA